MMKSTPIVQRSRRKIHRVVLALPLAVSALSLTALPVPARAAGGGPPVSVDLAKKIDQLAELVQKQQAIAQKQQALIESQAAQIKTLQGQLRSAVSFDASGNLVVPGRLAVGRSVEAGEDVKAGRHLVVQGQLAVAQNLAVGRDLVVDQSLLVKRDLVVQRSLSAGDAEFSSVQAGVGEFLELTAVNALRAVHGKFRWTLADVVAR